MQPSRPAASRQAPRPAGCSHAPGRAFPNPLIREMLRAFGILTCPDCGQALAILGRRRG